MKPKESKTLKISEILKHLEDNEECELYVNTTAVIKNAKQQSGDGWRLLRIWGHDEEDDKVITINLWNTLSEIDITFGDRIKIKNGQALNFRTSGDELYGQINCNIRYGSEVVLLDSKKIVVDGSNIAWLEKKKGKPDIYNIKIVMDSLIAKGYKPVVFVDASLRHLIPDGDKTTFDEWLETEFVKQAPSGVRADDIILQYADMKGINVVSNDTYNEYKNAYPWLRDKKENRHIKLNIVDKEVIFAGLKLI